LNAARVGVPDPPFDSEPLLDSDLLLSRQPQNASDSAKTAAPTALIVDFIFIAFPYR